MNLINSLLCDNWPSLSVCGYCATVVSTMSLLNNPFFRQRKHPRGAMVVIYLLLAGLLVLDALILYTGRNLYFAVRLRFALSAATVGYLNLALMVGALVAMFVHLVGSERSLTDMEYPGPVLVKVARMAGIQLAIVAVLQAAIIVVVPQLAGAVWPVAIAVVAAAAGAALLVISRRYNPRKRLPS